MSGQRITRSVRFTVSGQILKNKSDFLIYTHINFNTIVTLNYEMLTKVGNNNVIISRIAKL